MALLKQSNSPYILLCLYVHGVFQSLWFGNDYTLSKRFSIQWVNFKLSIWWSFGPIQSGSLKWFIKKIRLGSNRTSLIHSCSTNVSVRGRDVALVTRFTIPHTELNRYDSVRIRCTAFRFKLWISLYDLKLGREISCCEFHINI